MNSTPLSSYNEAIIEWPIIVFTCGACDTLELLVNENGEASIDNQWPSSGLVDYHFLGDMIFVGWGNGSGEGMLTQSRACRI